MSIMSIFRISLVISFMLCEISSQFGYFTYRVFNMELLDLAVE